jgi:hypothetical protein
VSRVEERRFGQYDPNLLRNVVIAAEIGLHEAAVRALLKRGGVKL